MNFIISPLTSLLLPVGELVRATRIPNAAVGLSVSESSASSQVENFVSSTECRSELLVTASLMFQPALK